MKKRRNNNLGRGGAVPPPFGTVMTPEKGRDCSAVARGVEQNYMDWLQASEISEADFLSRVDQDSFSLYFFRDEDMAFAALHEESGEIAKPLIWQKESGIDFESYKVDAALVLFFVLNKCQSPGSKEKIKSFVKTELFENNG